MPGLCLPGRAMPNDLLPFRGRMRVQIKSNPWVPKVHLTAWFARALFLSFCRGATGIVATGLWESPYGERCGSAVETCSCGRDRPEGPFA